MTQTLTAAQTAQVEKLMSEKSLAELRTMAGSAVGTKRDNATAIVLAPLPSDEEIYGGENVGDEAAAPKAKAPADKKGKAPKPAAEKAPREKAPPEDVTPFTVTWKDETYEVAPKRRSTRRPYVLKDGEEFDASVGLVINRWGRPKRAMPMGEVQDAKGKVLRAGALAR